MHRTDIEYLEIVRVLHDYSPTEQGCLSLKKGDLIYVQTKADNGWWMGVCKSDTGKSCLGANYIVVSENKTKRGISVKMIINNSSIIFN